MARRRSEASPKKLNGFWYYVRYVPSEVAHLDKRSKVVMSTGIRIADDPRGIQASKAVRKLDEEMLAYWTDLREGRDPNRVKRFDWATEMARRMGFTYVEGTEIRAQLGALMERVDKLKLLTSEQASKVRPVVFGEVPVVKQGPKVGELLDRFEAIMKPALMKKSERQLDRWRTTRKTALKAFTGLVGEEKFVEDLTHDDAYALLEFWKERVLAGEVLIDTANKQIGYVASMFREIKEYERLKMEDVFHRKVIRGGEKRQRRAFGVEHVQKVLLAAGAMDGLNDQARAIFYVVAELGLRPSEVCGLVKEDIHLNCKIPFIEIVEGHRELKTRNSRRTVPLVGVALEVMKHFPEGFDRYRDKGDVLSAVIQKHLKNSDLLECKGQSFYSLRHTFKDRLRRAKVNDEMIDMLMGHATGKEAYGDGYVLKQKHQVLTRIVFRAPPVCFGGVAVERGISRRPVRVRPRLSQAA